MIVKLGVPGRVKTLLLDIAHFRGNFPEKAQIAGIYDFSKDGPKDSDERWRNLTALSGCEADNEHTPERLDQGTIFTHVKLTIIPDGGVKRLRVFGFREE